MLAGPRQTYPLLHNGLVQESRLPERATDVLARLRRVRRWLLFILGGVAVALLPWSAYLSATLPSEHVTHHWWVAWVGFDLFEAAALIGTVIAVLKRSVFVTTMAAIAGTALLVDAWFDLATAAPGRDFDWAVVSAVFGEIPLAALCFWIAFEVGEVVGAIVGADPALAADPRPTSPPDRHEEARGAARRPGSEAPSAGRTSR
jgi:hypothetical protein